MKKRLRKQKRLLRPKLNRSSFRLTVFSLISKVPAGKVTTYKEVSQAMGNPSSQRAIAQILKTNLLPVEIPCHRVVKSDGRCGGWLGGNSAFKTKLLELEGIQIKDGIINLKRHFFGLNTNIKNRRGIEPKANRSL